MPVDLNEIELAALQLEPRIRGELIRRLLQTLDSADVSLSRDDWCEAWANEAERRDQEIEMGNVSPLKGSEVLREWQERFP